MTPHDHRQFVPGCYRCELDKDELTDAMDDHDWAYDMLVSVTLPIRHWEAIVQAASSYDRRLPPEQGDGQLALDVIDRAVATAKSREQQ